MRVVLSTRPARSCERQEDDLIWIDFQQRTISRGEVTLPSVTVYPKGRALIRRIPVWGRLFLFIAAMLARPFGSVVSRADLMDIMWGEQADGGPINPQRQFYLWAMSARPKFAHLQLRLVTEWGQGWSLEEGADVERLAA